MSARGGFKHTVSSGGYRLPMTIAPVSFPALPHHEWTSTGGGPAALVCEEVSVCLRGGQIRSAGAGGEDELDLSSSPAVAQGTPSVKVTKHRPASA
eukprot:750414-Hanusia_phi.AAC.4